MKTHLEANVRPPPERGKRTEATAFRHRPDPTVQRMAIVISELRAGGAERVVVHLARELKRLGVRTTVICLQREGPLAPELYQRQITVIAMKSLKGYDIPAIWRLAKVLRRCRPDVINVHDRSSLPYVVLANRLAGRRPIVFTCHGLLLGASARRVERLAMHDVQTVTAVSEETAEAYARELAWSERINIVPNGVPDIPRDPAARNRLRHKLGVPEEAFVFLAVGNVKPEKGFADLVRAASILANVAGQRPFRVLIAGGTWGQAHRAELDSLAESLGLTERVRFLGFRRDTHALYSAADAFVLSSRTEGLPMGLLEAMSAGLPTVATRVGGVPKVTADGNAALLVPSEAPEQLAQAMATLMDDDALRARVAGEARSLVRREYSIQRMASRYLATFRQAVRGRGGPVTSRKPRVLMLGPLPPLTGGMVTVTDNLRKSALRQRCRLTVLNNGKTTPEGRPFWTGVRAQSRLLGRVLTTILRENIQIVHIHTIQFFGFWRDCTHMAMARLLGCRVFLHNHGASFDQWAAEMGPLRRGVLRACFELSTGVIALTEGWRKRLLPFAPRARWHVIPNAVPVPPEANNVADSPPVFLFLGDWTARKGVRDLVAATVLALEHGFTGRVDLAGFEKEPGQLDALKQQIAEGDCGHVVRILGTLSLKEKDEALTRAQCLVLPSYAEGLPMAILEAMAHSLPIIATRVGAIGEAVSDGQEGFLIGAGDVEALADRMLRLAGDPDLRHRMGEAARRRAEAEFSLDAMVDRIVALYDEVLT